MTDKAAYEIAERNLINLPGYAIKIEGRYFIHLPSGIVRVSPGEYCRVMGLAQ